jgi:8-oxo-dGTP diphosphatase
MARPETPALTADCVVFDSQDRVLLIRRGRPPFEGDYALPGGFVEVGETVEDACRRELKEETGIEVRELKLVGVYSDPKRDPRGHTCSVAYLAQVATAKRMGGGLAPREARVRPRRHHRRCRDAQGPRLER